MLRAEGFARLKGKNVGLVTNHTGIARDGTTTIDLLYAAKDMQAGRAVLAQSTASAASWTRKCRRRRDEKTGLPIYSLYGEDAPSDRRRC